MISSTAPLSLINGVAKLLNQFLAPCLRHSRFQLIDQVHISAKSEQPLLILPASVRITVCLNPASWTRKGSQVLC